MGIAGDLSTIGVERVAHFRAEFVELTFQQAAGRRDALEEALTQPPQRWRQAVELVEKSLSDVHMSKATANGAGGCQTDGAKNVQGVAISPISIP
jgi:hypothetical protein